MSQKPAQGGDRVSRKQGRMNEGRGGAVGFPTLSLLGLCMACLLCLPLSPGRAHSLSQGPAFPGTDLVLQRSNFSP